MEKAAMTQGSIVSAISGVSQLSGLSGSINVDAAPL